MSDNSHADDTDHSGPIKNPKQLLITVLFAFLVPIFAIIGLVYYVTSANMLAAGTVNAEKSADERIQKVGTVEIRDANRVLKTGEEVFKAQCTTCHTAGVAGAPKFGDAAAWAPRIAKGYDALLNSALHGKGAMSPQGGGDFEDLEIGRAVVYMTSAAGGKFPEPQAAPAATAQAAPAAAAPATAAAPSATPVAVAAAAAAPAPAANVGETRYKETCFACHATGVAGAPKFGDKAAWAPRIATGMDTLVATAIAGKGAMPPKGGSNASDAEIKATVAYMVNAAK
ncbi:MAG: c-type cytochrome [Rhodoferax sp.]|nr:c-type cytochrome [Rhodoferax sp.]